MTRHLPAVGLLCFAAACAPLTDGSALLTGPVPPASQRVASFVCRDLHCERDTLPEHQPLFVVDGRRIGLSAGGKIDPLAMNFRPEDIESIEILKGPAAAAVYGSSGRCGAILITTKKKPKTS